MDMVPDLKAHITESWELLEKIEEGFLHLMHEENSQEKINSILLAAQKLTKNYVDMLSVFEFMELEMCRKKFIGYQCYKAECDGR